MHLQIQYFYDLFFSFFNLRYTFHKWTPLWPLKHKSCTTVSFNKQNRSDIQLRSKWNKHHLFSNPSFQTNLQTNATFISEHYTVFRGTITNYGCTLVFCCNRGGKSTMTFISRAVCDHSSWNDFSTTYIQRLLITVVCDIMNLDICSMIFNISS